MTSPDWRNEARSFATKVMDRFLLPREMSEFLLNFRHVRASLPPVYSGLADAFEKNVSAVVATVSIPVTLASAAVEGSHWQRIYTAERIRALMLAAEAGEDEAAFEKRRGEHAQRSASEEMREFATSRDGQDKIAADTCAFLVKALRSASSSAAAAELILQGSVLTWSALETLARDLFEAVLNADPKRALAVIEDPAAKQRLQSRFTLAELASFGFNVASSLGTLLVAGLDFSDIRTIKAGILPALNSDVSCASALGEKTLWILCQQRHLILHRRGVIDGRYLEATGEQQQIGSRLSISPAELEAQIKTVVSAGCALLAAAVKLPNNPLAEPG